MVCVWVSVCNIFLNNTIFQKTKLKHKKIQTTCNSRSTCTSHTGCFAWRGRARACWRSPRAGTLSRCTCRFWLKPSGLQGSWADHLAVVVSDGGGGDHTRNRTPEWVRPLRQGDCEKGSFTYWSISDSIAEVRPRGFHTAEGDIWLCYISHGLPTRKWVK